MDEFIYSYHAFREHLTSQEKVHKQNLTAPTFDVEQVGSADFVLQVVDEHRQLAGVDSSMGAFYSRDCQGSSARLKGSGVKVLSEKKYKTKKKKQNKMLLLLIQALI